MKPQKQLDPAIPAERDFVLKFLNTHPNAIVALQFHDRPQPKYRDTEDFFPLDTPTASSEKPQNSTRFICLSMLLAVPSGTTYQTVALKCGTFDGQVKAVLKQILSCPNYVFTGYHLPIDLCWLHHLGLPIPADIWDVRIFQRLSTLGQINVKARAANKTDLSRQISSKETLKGKVYASLDMLNIAQRNNVHVGVKPVLRVVLEIYHKQSGEAEKEGIDTYLHRVEMPWLKTTAELHYFGVNIDRSTHEMLTRHATRDLSAVKHKLQEYGISDPGSEDNVYYSLCRNGLEELCSINPKSNRASIKEDLVRMHQKRHPLIQLIHRYRELRSLLFVQNAVSTALTPENKVHPCHIQLGTETGRQTCTKPNLLGFDKMLRNTVIPDTGYGIAELDYSQQEVGIAAGLYQDEALTEFFNTGDVYTQIAQRSYAGTDKVMPGAENLSWEEFKSQYPELRALMKTVTLAVFYGQSSYGLAKSLDIDEERAADLLKSYFKLFPQLDQGLRNVTKRALLDMHVDLVSGLRIYLDTDRGISQAATKRLSRNYPIQAMGAVIFKTAGVQLREVFAPHDARLLVPMHDAFIFQAPVDQMDEVVSKACKVMRSAMQEFFPQLEPRINVNTEYPQRWTKDSHPTALQEYLNIEPGSL